MNKTLKLLQANLLELTRNRAAIFWTIMFPIMFILIFGLIYTNNDTSKLKVGLVVNDPSPVTQQISDSVAKIPVFEIKSGTQADLEDQLKNGKLSAVIIFGQTFSQDLAKQKAEIIIKYDPGSQTTAQIAISALHAATEQINQGITQVKQPVTVVSTSVQAQKTRQIDWLVAGILGMSIMQLGLFSSAALVTLREKKILRRFAVTPVSRIHIVIAQVLFRLCFGLTQSTVLLITGRLVYHVQIDGNILLMYGVIILGLMMFLAMGYIIASLAKNEEVVEPLVQVFSMPMMFLSGVFFPIDLMPKFIQPVIKILPLSYLNNALRAVINNNQSLYAIRMDITVMAIWLVVSLVVAVRLFKWE